MLGLDCKSLYHWFACRRLSVWYNRTKSKLSYRFFLTLWVVKILELSDVCLWCESWLWETCWLSSHFSVAFLSSCTQIPGLDIHVNLVYLISRLYFYLPFRTSWRIRCKMICTINTPLVSGFALSEKRKRLDALGGFLFHSAKCIFCWHSDDPEALR